MQNIFIIYGLILFSIFNNGIYYFAQTLPGFIKKDIDWRLFLSRHDLVWEKIPYDYFNAPFLGNGLLGAMLYAPEGEKLPAGADLQSVAGNSTGIFVGIATWLKG